MKILPSTFFKYICQNYSMGNDLIWDQHSPAGCQNLGMICFSHSFSTNVLEYPEHSVGHTVNPRHHLMETLITVQQDTKQIITMKTKFSGVLKPHVETGKWPVVSLYILLCSYTMSPMHVLKLKLLPWQPIWIGPWIVDRVWFDHLQIVVWLLELQDEIWATNRICLQFKRVVHLSELWRAGVKLMSLFQQGQLGGSFFEQVLSLAIILIILMVWSLKKIPSKNGRLHCTHVRFLITIYLSGLCGECWSLSQLHTLWIKTINLTYISVCICVSAPSIQESSTVLEE